MTWPAGVRTASLTAASALSILGRDFPGTLTVSADFGDVDSLTWIATGEVFLSLSDSASAPGNVEFPHPAQVGWRDPAGNIVTGWALIATLSYGPPRSPVTLRRRFTLSDLVDRIDFRDLIDDQTSEPNSVTMFAPVDDSSSSTVSTFSSDKILKLISEGGADSAPGASLTLGQINTALLVPHVNDPEPHPAYDDIPDLALLFNTHLI